MNSSSLLFLIPSLLDSPINGNNPMPVQVIVCLGEMLAAEKAAESGERRRMRRFKDQMPLPINQLFLSPGITAPQNEY